MTGLRGEAAIVGIAELPAEKTADRAAVVHARPVRAAGEDGDRGCRRGSGCGERAFDARHRGVEHVRAGHAVGVPGPAAGLRRPRRPRRCDRGGHGVAGRRGRRAGAVRRGARRDAGVDRSPAVGIAARAARSAGSARRATTTARRRPSSRSRTATSARTARTRRSRSATPHEFGYDAAALARIAVHQRTNACAHPGAVFHGKPITVDDVLNSPVIADPIHMLETVMRVQGGAGVLIANADVARRGPSPPGVDQGVRRAHPIQDTDLRRRPHPHARSPAPPNARSRWRGCSGPTSTWRRSTTATRSPC